MFKIGIIGLAQAGKTTLFRILTRAQGAGPAAGKTELRVGVVRVPDSRLDRLSEIYRPKKTIHATIECVDTPGSVIDLARSGAAAATLREFDALAHVVRAFGDESTSPLSGEANLQKDIENVELELMLSDLAIIEKRLERLEKDVKKQRNPNLERELHTLNAVKSALENQTPLRELALTPEERQLIRGFAFLSAKPVLYVFNLSEEDAARVDAAEALAAEAGLRPRAQTEATAICGKVEAEVAELDPVEAEEFLASYGLRESAVSRLIRACYHLLGLLSFFTVGEDECRAWTIRRGTTALEAAGEIHSDIQRGFIRAEVIAYDDLVAAGGFAEARSRGRLRLEGKEYVIRDGEVVHFRHAG